MVHPAIPPDADRPNLLNGLVRKRAQIAGQLAANRAEFRRLTGDLQAVEQTIRLFEPAVALSAIRALPPPREHPALFHGEVTSLVYEVLGDASRPVTAAHIAVELMRQRGIDASDRLTRLLLTRRVGACLRAKRATGIVRSSPTSAGLTWELSL